jgi:lysozyme family protein
MDLLTRSNLIAARILDREGDYVDRAEDRGGPTNFGITIKTLSEIRGTPQTATNVKQLTKLEAKNIYLTRYIMPFEKIADDNLFDLVVDTAVNNGRGRAALWLQRAAGVMEDGIIGPVTLARVNGLFGRWVNDHPVVYYKLCAVRMKAYGALISQQHSQATFAAGWMNRLAEFVGREY